jgi:hypothetical protein
MFSDFCSVIGSHVNQHFFSSIIWVTLQKIEHPFKWTFHFLKHMPFPQPFPFILVPWYPPIPLCITKKQKKLEQVFTLDKAMDDGLHLCIMHIQLHLSGGLIMVKLASLGFKLTYTKTCNPKLTQQATTPTNTTM